VQLVSKIFNVCGMIHQRHRQTDGQTDDMRSQDRAYLHYRPTASRGKSESRVADFRQGAPFCAMKLMNVELKDV